jgi:energy-coupling factor transport system permease protein
MTYRRLATPLHAARASVAAAYCGSLALVGLCSEHPLLLLASIVAVVGAGLCAGVERELGRAVLLALPLAVLIFVLNPVANHAGLTVLVRGWEVPVLGQLDITLEAVAHGGVFALRIPEVILASALYSAAVDPDEILRLFRRFSFRSALSATLATRLVPVLARDARRLADAQRCRPGAAAPRLAIVRATAAGALERAVDVAATLELRGYALASPRRTGARPWSRHDLAFAASAVALLALALLSAFSGAGELDAYPRLELSWGPATWVLAAAIPACALLPFLDRRGVER